MIRAYPRDTRRYAWTVLVYIVNAISKMNRWYYLLALRQERDEAGNANRPFLSGKDIT